MANDYTLRDWVLQVRKIDSGEPYADIEVTLGLKNYLENSMPDHPGKIIFKDTITDDSPLCSLKPYPVGKFLQKMVFGFGEEAYAGYSMSYGDIRPCPYYGFEENAHVTFKLKSREVDGGVEAVLNNVRQLTKEGIPISPDGLFGWTLYLANNPEYGGLDTCLGICKDADVVHKLQAQNWNNLYSALVERSSMLVIDDVKPDDLKKYIEVKLPVHWGVREKLESLAGSPGYLLRDDDEHKRLIFTSTGLKKGLLDFTEKLDNLVRNGFADYNSF